MKPEIFAYYFPNYHLDARNQKQHGEGWSEWELVKAARPRFAGHEQPKVPLWGYEDEADPQVMARKIDAAADHGLDGFIFDWYWYEDGPFLERALDEGFLNAPNNERLKFALMWANHDWADIHPASTEAPPETLYSGAVSRAGWERLTDRVVEYFLHPSYWLISGCPYFSIYDFATFVKSSGGVDGACEAMEIFRAKVRAAGFPDLHLNIAALGLAEWTFQVLPTEQRIASPVQAAERMSAASTTPYVWIHHHNLNGAGFPLASYDDCARSNYASWEESARGPIPFFPNVTMGWDCTPRCRQSDAFENSGYPFMSLLDGNTPQAFEAALREAKRFLETHPNAVQALTINAWNEWTEGSYLEPDTQNGLAYLEAIREVFGG